MGEEYSRVKHFRKTVNGYVVESSWTSSDTVYMNDGSTATQAYDDLTKHISNNNLHLNEDINVLLNKLSIVDGRLYFDGKKVILDTDDYATPSDETITYQKLIQDMGIGYNYGNTYEAFDNWDNVDNVIKNIKEPVTYTGKTTSPNLQSLESHTKSWQLLANLYVDDNKWDWVATDGNCWANDDGVIKLEWNTSTVNKTGNLIYLGLQVFSHQNDNVKNGITTGTMNAHIKASYGGTVFMDKDVTLNCTANDGTYQTETFAINSTDLGKSNVPIGKTIQVEFSIKTFPDVVVYQKDLLDVNDNKTYTLWGNARMNKVCIDMLKEKGFKTVRLPISWGNHTNHDGKIDDEWFEEVKFAVDTIMNSGMYCIINIHGDTMEQGWLKADYDNIDTMKAKLSGLWVQIANYFKSYNDHLLFEGFNEVLMTDSNGTYMWSGYSMNSTETVKTYKAIYELNQTFIDTVRTTGGNNSNRWLICSAYACNWEGDMVSKYITPTDSANRILVQFHVYRNLSGSKEALDIIYNRFSKENIGVIIGEWGARADAASTTEREKYAYEFAKYCKQLGFHCDWWDDGGFNKTNIDQVNNFGILGRGDYNVWIFETIADSIISGYND